MIDTGYFGITNGSSVKEMDDSSYCSNGSLSGVMARDRTVTTICLAVS